MTNVDDRCKLSILGKEDFMKKKKKKMAINVPIHFLYNNVHSMQYSIEQLNQLCCFELVN